jgi:hypothetical protein
MPVFAVGGAIVGAASAEPIVHPYSLDEVEGARSLFDAVAEHADLLTLLKNDLSDKATLANGHEARFDGSVGQEHQRTGERAEVQMVARIFHYSLIGEIEDDPSVELFVEGATAVSADWASGAYYCDWSYRSSSRKLSLWSSNNAELFVRELHRASRKITGKIWSALRPRASNCNESSSTKYGPSNYNKMWALRGLAEQANAEAQYELSNLVSDDGEKRMWSCLAANRNHRYAQFVFGGLESDPIQKFKWFHLADSNGHPTAKNFLDDLSKDWTSEQITEGERLVAEWKPDPASCEIDAAQLVK